MTAAVVIRNDDFERRARVLPWGIEVQVWRLVETLTLPGTPQLFRSTRSSRNQTTARVPTVRNDDEKTLENPVEDSTSEPRSSFSTTTTSGGGGDRVVARPSTTGGCLWPEAEARAALQRACSTGSNARSTYRLVGRARLQVAPQQPDPARLAMTTRRSRCSISEGPGPRWWTYFNTSDPADRGSVADFMIRRDGATLESCVNGSPAAPPARISRRRHRLSGALRDRRNTLHAAESTPRRSRQSGT